MDSLKSSEPKKESSGDKKVTPAQEFMDSDEVSKKVILNKMASVMEMESILPKQLSSWDKDTTAMVLEKALGLCGISTSTTVETTGKETRLKQEGIELQIKALKEKMDRNAALLEEHRKAREAIEIEREGQNLMMQNLAEQQHHLEIVKMQLGENHPDVRNMQLHIDNSLNAVRALQEHLDGLELGLPLRD